MQLCGSPIFQAVLCIIVAVVKVPSEVGCSCDVCVSATAWMKQRHAVFNDSAQLRNVTSASHYCKAVLTVSMQAASLHYSYSACFRQGKANFGDAGVFIEKYVQRARHIEVQMFGDGQGNMVTFVERECSIQRRHQKIVEETPSPYVGKAFLS